MYGIMKGYLLCQPLVYYCQDQLVNYFQQCNALVLITYFGIRTSIPTPDNYGSGFPVNASSVSSRTLFHASTFAGLLLLSVAPCFHSIRCLAQIPLAPGNLLRCILLSSSQISFSVGRASFSRGPDTPIWSSLHLEW
jgi:hypothetical protein